MKLATATINDIQHQWQKQFKRRLEARAGSRLKVRIYPATEQLQPGLYRRRYGFRRLLGLRVDSNGDRWRRQACWQVLLDLTPEAGIDRHAGLPP